eukprot:symbB.v1.2.035880.t1/scaffold4938.1/size32623/1
MRRFHGARGGMELHRRLRPSRQQAQIGLPMISGRVFVRAVVEQEVPGGQVDEVTTLAEMVLPMYMQDWSKGLDSDDEEEEEEVPAACAAEQSDNKENGQVLQYGDLTCGK